MASSSGLTFDKMMSKDHAESTKCGYHSLVKHFHEFLTVLKPAAIRGQGEVDLEQVTLEDVKGFFNHVLLGLGQHTCCKQQMSC